MKEGLAVLLFRHRPSDTAAFPSARLISRTWALSGLLRSKHSYISNLLGGHRDTRWVVMLWVYAQGGGRG